MMMKRFGWLLCLVPAIAFAQQDLSGKWAITTDIYGNPLTQKLTLKSDAGKLTGKFDGDDLEGAVHGNAIHFVAKDKDGNTSEYTGTITGDTFYFRPRASTSPRRGTCSGPAAWGRAEYSFINHWYES